MMKKFLLQIFCFTVLFTSAFAQDRTITGTVTDKADGQPLPGVSVKVKGTQTGTVTDASGKYVVKTSANGTLTFTYIGYVTQELPIGSSSSVNVGMASDSKQLGEVVVTALGIQRRKNELPFAAQEIKSEEVTKTRDNNFINSLSGKVSGLQIKKPNTIGGSTNVVLRGAKSLSSSNQALFVVDGVPVDNSSSVDNIGSNGNTNNQRQGGTGYDYGNPGADINPDDIESINVLKGAAASALYGSRAANGVIIITTKKGKKGLGVTINSGITFGSVDKTTFPKYQTEYGEGYGQFYGPDQDSYFEQADLNGDGVLDLIVPTGQDASYGGRFDPNLSVYDWKSLDPSSSFYLQKTPWVAAKNGPASFFENPMTYNNSFSIDGGGDQGTYKLGYTRTDDYGILPNSRINKDLLNFGFTYKLTEKLSAQANVNYSKVKGLGRYSTGYSDNIMSNFRQWWPVNVDIQEQKDAYFRNRVNNTWNYKDASDVTPAYWDNPYFQRYENYEQDSRDRYFGNVSLNYKVFPWMDILARVAMDNYNEVQEERFAVGSTTVSSYSRANRSFKETNYDLLVNFNKKISSSFDIKGVLGTNIRRQDINYIQSQTNGGLVVPGLYSLSNSVNPLNPPTENVDRKLVTGIFGSATLGFKEMLFLDMTLRRDQSTSLPIANNSYYYPSVAGSFLFSTLTKEALPWLSYGKVRLNYAEVGNDAPARSIVDVYSKPAGYGSIPIFNVSTTKNNLNLKPERTKSSEAGLEASFFDSRVGFDFSYYQTNTIDQILPVSISTATGYNLKFVNSGDVQNRGIEFTLYGSPIRTANFAWNVNVNFARNRNKVLSLFEGVDNLQLASYQQGVTINATVGQPYGVLRGANFVYLNGQKIVDPITDDDGNVVDAAYRISSTSNEIIGNANPDWTGGVNNNFRYKNFSLGFLVDVSKGGSIFSLDQAYGQDTGVYPVTAGLNDLGNPKRNLIADGGGVILPGVNPDGTPNTIRSEANASGTAYGYERNPNAAFVYDASYVKLREVTIGYSLPSKLIAKLGPLKGVDFSLIGRNLWIIHKNLPFADPEDGFGSGTKFQGVQIGSYPAVRNYGFNVKVRF